MTNSFEALSETIMPADLDENVVLIIAPGSRTITTHTIDLLLDEYTNVLKPVVIRLYKEVGGQFYLRGGPAESPIGGSQTYTPGTGGPLRFFLHGSVTRARTRITAQSTGLTAESAPRTIRWSYGYRI